MENVTLDQVKTPESACSTFNRIINELTRIATVIQPITDKFELKQRKQAEAMEKIQTKEMQKRAEEEAEKNALMAAESQAAEEARRQARAEFKAREIVLSTPEAIEQINQARNAAAAEKDATAEDIAKAVIAAKESIWQNHQLGEPADRK